MAMQIHATTLCHKGGLFGQKKKFMPSVPLQVVSSALTSDPTACGRGLGRSFLGF